jgi:hypothetical protein
MGGHIQGPSPPPRPSLLPSMPTDKRLSDWQWMRDKDRTSSPVMKHLAAENAYARLLLTSSDEQKQRISSIRKEIESHIWAMTMNHALVQDQQQAPSPSRPMNLGGDTHSVKLVDSPGPHHIRWLRGRTDASIMLPPAQVDAIFGPCHNNDEEGRNGPYTLVITGRDGATCEVPRASGPYLWSPDGQKLFFLASSCAQLWSIEPSSAQPTPRLLLTDPEWLEMDFVTLPCGLHTVQAKNNDGTTSDTYLLLQLQDGWNWEHLVLKDEHSGMRGRRMIVQSLIGSGHIFVRQWSAEEPFGSIFIVSISSEGKMKVQELIKASPGCRIIYASADDDGLMLVVEEEVQEIEMRATEMIQIVLNDDPIPSSSDGPIEGPSSCAFRIMLFGIDFRNAMLSQQASTSLTLPLPFVKIDQVQLQKQLGVPVVKLKISSLGLPSHTIRFPMAYKESCHEVHLKPQYKHQRLWFRSHDSCLIPVSLITALDVNIPHPPSILMKAYGAFGLEDDVGFSPSRLPLVDRGWVLALVHVRGGGQLGPGWHQAGKGRRRHNGAEDLRAGINAISKLFGAQSNVCVEAESAGAWCALPALTSPSPAVKGALLTVPSLDPVSDLLEQGYAWHELLDSPSSADDIRASSSYPYLRSSVDPLATPSSVHPHPIQSPRSLFVRCGLKDVRVGYWEGLGFVAGARAAANGQRICCFKVKDGSHDCFSTAQDDAEACSFLIDAVESQC